MPRAPLIHIIAILQKIPVEIIIGCGLKLQLGFSDLRKKLKLGDVLGATYVKEG
jgi:hypothetical protein